jgi:transposase-like protein
MEELLPWLYLKGVSTGDFGEALESLLGRRATGLSPSVISRLKAKWSEEHLEWSKRSLTGKHYVYIWADAVYFPVRGEESKQCILVVLGATPEGRKELLALEEGYRESSESWRVLLRGIRERGLNIPPSLAVADGALGFWNALSDVYPETRRQRCWFHKIANVLDQLPKSMQGAARQHLKQIQMAPTKEEAQQEWTRFVKMYDDKYPGAVKILNKSKGEMLTFFDFPAKHWVHLRTSNVIESVFSTVRLRTAKTRNCVSRQTILSLVYRLVSTAEKRWNRLRGSEELGKVITGIKFRDGIEATEIEQLDAA